MKGRGKVGAMRMADKYADERLLIIDIFVNSRESYGYRRVHISLKKSFDTVTIVE